MTQQQKSNHIMEVLETSIEKGKADYISKLKRETMYSRQDLEDATYELSKSIRHKDYTICPLTIARLMCDVFEMLDKKNKEHGK